MADAVSPSAPDGRLDPDEVAAATFAASFRGWDQGQVGAYLARVADELRAGRAESDELTARVTAAEERAATAVDADDATLTARLGERTAVILSDARENATEVVAAAEARAAEVVREAQDEARRMRDGAETERRRGFEEGVTAAEALVAAAEGRRAAADAEVDGARQDAIAAVEASRQAILDTAEDEGRALIAEAQAVREKVLGDLARRRKAGRRQLEQLAAARERLLAALGALKRAVEEATTDLRVSLPEARLAAEAAARRTDAEAEPSVAALEAEIGALRMAGLPLGVADDRADASHEPAADVGADLAAGAGRDAVGAVTSGGRRATPGRSEGPAGDDPDDTRPESGLRAFRVRNVASVAGRAAAPLYRVDPAAPFEEVRLYGPRPPTSAPTAAPRPPSWPDVSPSTEPLADPWTVEVEQPFERPDPGGRSGAEAEPATGTAPEPAVAVESDLVADVDPVLDPVAVESDLVADVDPVLDPVAVESDLVADVDPVLDPVAVESDPVADGEPEPVADAEPEPTPVAASPRPAPLRVVDVDALFARLRGESVAGPPDAADAEAAPPPAPAPTARPAPASTGPLVADPVEVRPPAVGVPFGAGPERDDLLARRDGVVDPVAATLARHVKRALADEQNELLDRLRRHRGGDLTDVVPDLDERIGWWTTAVMDSMLDVVAAGATLVDPAAEPGAGALDALADELMASIVVPLRTRVLAAVEGAEGDVDVAADRVRGRYREWRSHRVEEVARHLAHAAYARGAFDAAVGSGSRLCWVADDGGIPCPDAEDNALTGPTAPGAAYPTGDLLPPAHPGCRCLLVPAP